MPGTPALDRLGSVLVAAIVALPLIQLVPLPPVLWTALPGRAPFARDFVDAGVPVPWLPLSLSPTATRQSAFALIPPLAAFLLVRQLDHAGRRGLSLVLIAFALVSVLVGLAQIAQGPASPLRFYPVTNPSESVGFFANRNHYAALLCAVIPVTAAWLVALVLNRPQRWPWVAAAGLAVATLLLGLGMAASRAGLLLAVLAGVASLGMAVAARDRASRTGIAVIAAAWAIGLLLAVNYAFFRILGRLDTDLLADLRLVIADITLAAAHAFQPVGSGLGTFQAIYQIYETPGALLPAYVNHAHNDWLELWLEAGWPAAAILVLFLAWFGHQSVRAWRASTTELQTIDRALPQAASIAATLLLLHSLVDYPLRTTALSVVFASALAMLLPSPTPAAGNASAPPRPRPLWRAARFKVGSRWKRTLRGPRF